MWRAQTRAKPTVGRRPMPKNSCFIDGQGNYAGLKSRVPVPAHHSVPLEWQTAHPSLCTRGTKGSGAAVLKISRKLIWAGAQAVTTREGGRRREGCARGQNCGRGAAQLARLRRAAWRPQPATPGILLLLSRLSSGTAPHVSPRKPQTRGPHLGAAVGAWGGPRLPAPSKATRAPRGPAEAGAEGTMKGKQTPWEHRKHPSFLPRYGPGRDTLAPGLQEG